MWVFTGINVTREDGNAVKQTHVSAYYYLYIHAAVKVPKIIQIDNTLDNTDEIPAGVGYTVRFWSPGVRQTDVESVCEVLSTIGLRNTPVGRGVSAKVARP